MRLLIIIMFLSLIYIVSSKNNVKTLTESLGQEVIEMGTPIKELPMGLDEEPSAETDDDDKPTSNTVPPATKKDSKKTTTLLSDVKKTVKDAGKIETINIDDEEARIEKELAEIYKDTPDYKTDGDDKEVAKELPNELSNHNHTDGATSSDDSDKPIGRQKTNFKFQPDSTDKEDVERFRTSVDEISCNNRQKLSGTPTPSVGKNNAFDTISNGFALIAATLCFVFICT